MNERMYQMIFKRRSFHLFRDTGRISREELDQIQEAFCRCSPLHPDIRVEMKLVPAAQTTCKRGEEYCILLYSEQKPGYLPNIGYIGQQLDLLLAAMDIGALWFGMGKSDVPSDSGLGYVIMLAIAKMDPTKFRRDMFKSKRKPLKEIWAGQHYLAAADIARFAPSACNTQPWFVESGEGELRVYRYKKPGKRGIMPAAKVAHYNRIDIGIFLLILEVCLKHEGFGFTRELFDDAQDGEKTLIASYKMEGAS